MKCQAPTLFKAPDVTTSVAFSLPVTQKENIVGRGAWEDHRGRIGGGVLAWSSLFHCIKAARMVVFKFTVEKKHIMQRTVILVFSLSHSFHLDLSKKYHTVLSQIFRSNSVSTDVGMRREGAD